jgi:hypothetical protein
MSKGNSNGLSVFTAICVALILVMEARGLYLEYQQQNQLSTIETTVSVVGDGISTLLDSHTDTDPSPSINVVPQNRADKYIRDHPSRSGAGINIPIELFLALRQQVANHDKHPNGRSRTDIKGHRAYWGIGEHGETVAVIYPLVEDTIASGQTVLAVTTDVYQNEIVTVRVDDHMDPCPQACYCAVASGPAASHCTFTP